MTGYVYILIDPETCRPIEDERSRTFTYTRRKRAEAKARKLLDDGVAVTVCDVTMDVQVLPA